MTDDPHQQRSQILDAVQAALTGFGEQVKAEFDGLRSELAAERAARTAAQSRLSAFAAALEQSRHEAAAQQSDLQERLQNSVAEAQAAISARLAIGDARLEAVETRTASDGHAAAVLTERVASVEALAADTATEVDTRVEALQAQAAEFAAEVGAGFAERSRATEQVAGTVAGLVAASAALEERLDATRSKFHDDLTTSIAATTASTETQVDEAEQRLRDLVASSETRSNEAFDARFTELDQEFERAAARVESSIAALNERSNDIDGRVADLVERVAALQAVVDDMDADIIDDLSERVSTAAGETVLLRIETERFHDAIRDTNNKMALRITELEAQFQVQAMDVESAVQLERLEEIERALIELDPSQFVRVDGVQTPATRVPNDSEVPFVTSNGETDSSVAGRSDEPTPPKPTLPSSSG